MISQVLYDKSSGLKSISQVDLSFTYQVGRVMLIINYYKSSELLNDLIYCGAVDLAAATSERTRP